jgi:hypothetical protein
MSEAKPFAFPRMEPGVSTPNWLEDNRQQPVRSLLSHLNGEEPAPANTNNQYPPEPEPPPPPAHPAGAPPSAHTHAHAHEPQHAHEPHAFDLPAEEQRALSRLPPPPKVGSLIPGARSNPPPAHDAAHTSALRERAEAFANAAIELAIARAATLAVLEGQLLDLSVEIAAAVIEREVEQAPELHAALARAALGSLGDAGHVTLRTSPDGYETICAALGGEEVDVRGVRVHVLADDTLPGLGCVVDGENVRIDATVSERLRAVRRAFEEERRKSMENVE